MGPWLYTTYSISLDFLSCSKTVFNQIHSMIYPISFSVLSAIFLSHFKKLLHLKSDTIKTLPTFPQSSEILQDEIISSQSIASCSIYHHVFNKVITLQMLLTTYNVILYSAFTCCSYSCSLCHFKHNKEISFPCLTFIPYIAQLCSLNATSTLLIGLTCY